VKFCVSFVSFGEETDRKEREKGKSDETNKTSRGNLGIFDEITGKGKD
jgi:hypothetical protein